MLAGVMPHEENSLPEISPWIPVIATLLGAGLGFGGSFAVAKYNRSIEQQNERENRERKRIERSFELLVLIDLECGNLMFSCLKWVNSGEPMKDDQKLEIPPMIELKMIVDLYFHELSVGVK